MNVLICLFTICTYSIGALQSVRNFGLVFNGSASHYFTPIRRPFENRWNLAANLGPRYFRRSTSCRLISVFRMEIALQISFSKLFHPRLIFFLLRLASFFSSFYTLIIFSPLICRHTPIHLSACSPFKHLSGFFFPIFLIHFGSHRSENIAGFTFFSPLEGAKKKGLFLVVVFFHLFPRPAFWKPAKRKWRETAKVWYFYRMPSVRHRFAFQKTAEYKFAPKWRRVLNFTAFCWVGTAEWTPPPPLGYPFALFRPRRAKRLENFVCAE